MSIDVDIVVKTLMLDKEILAQENHEAHATVSQALIAIRQLQVRIHELEGKTTPGQPSELELHRADYRACKDAGFESPSELLAAYNILLKQRDTVSKVANPFSGESAITRDSVSFSHKVCVVEETFPKISLDEFRKLHRAGGVLYSIPSSWSVIADDVPTELVQSWKQYTEALARHKSMLFKYDLEK